MDLWGGDFFADELYVAIEQIGPQLTKLNLVHIEELDYNAILILSKLCANLKFLGFANCGFREPSARDDEAFHFLDRMARQEEEALLLSMRWLDLEKLQITSTVKLNEI